MLRIIQISDLHLPSSDEELVEGINTRKRFESLINHLKKQPADLLVITGDIAGYEENKFSYELLKKSLEASLPYPWIALPGNHDRGTLFKDILGDGSTEGFQIKKFREDAAPVLFFDNSSEAPDHSALEELATYLGHTRQMNCLFTHYHPVPVGHPTYDKKHRSAWQELFFDVLQKSSLPLYVFFGHIHFEFQQTMNQLSFYSVPSATLPILPAIGGDRPDGRGLFYRSINIVSKNCDTEVHYVPSIQSLDEK